MKGSNYIFYIIVFLVFFLLKIGFRSADLTQIQFLLSPTNFLVELFTNSNGVFNNQNGYFHESLNIVIGASCSGFNFWVLCFTMLSFLVINFLKHHWQKIISIPLMLLVTYGLTILVNTSRIVVAIFGQKSADIFMGERPHYLLHSSISIFIYLFFLVTIYVGFDYMLNKLKLNNEELA